MFKILISFFILIVLVACGYSVDGRKREHSGGVFGYYTTSSYDEYDDTDLISYKRSKKYKSRKYKTSRKSKKRKKR